jgi:hypothetical protein
LTAVLPVALALAAETLEDRPEAIEEMPAAADFVALAMAEVAFAALETTVPVALCAKELGMVMPDIDWAATMAGRMKTVKRILKFSANNQLMSTSHQCVY